MRSPFGRGLVPLSPVLAGLTLPGIVLAIAAFAFNSFTEHVQRSERDLVADAALRAGAAPAISARDLARTMAPHARDPVVIFVAVDATTRASVLWSARAVEHDLPHLVLRGRADRSAEPQTAGTIPHLILGLGTAFGLSTLRTSVGSLQIYAAPNERAFVDDVRAYVPAFAIAVMTALLFAVAAARLFTREALRPLDDVTGALERFASGDFTPEPVAATDGRLGALALAYNGAVAQVERSFAERERAQTTMRQFISDAGHQLKTPLTVIRGFLGVLSGDACARDAEIAHVIASMTKQTVLMGALIDKLILLERWETGRVPSGVPVDVSAFVRETLEPMALAYPARTLIVRAAADATAMVDHDDLRHALGNVVENAFKYTHGPIEVDVSRAGDDVCVAVRDDGPGLDPRDASRAFDRFFRGPRRDVEGSGLGLAIAQRAVERAHGRIEFESSRETGTVVRLHLPRHAG